MPPLGIIEIQINIPVHYFASHAISSPLLDIFSCLHDVTANLATSLVPDHIFYVSYLITSKPHKLEFKDDDVFFKIFKKFEKKKNVRSHKRSTLERYVR